MTMPCCKDTPGLKLVQELGETLQRDYPGEEETGASLADGDTSKEPFSVGKGGWLPRWKGSQPVKLLGTWNHWQISISTTGR